MDGGAFQAGERGAGPGRRRARSGEKFRKRDFYQKDLGAVNYGGSFLENEVFYTPEPGMVGTRPARSWAATSTALL